MSEIHNNHTEHFESAERDPANTIVNLFAAVEVYNTHVQDAAISDALQGLKEGRPATAEEHDDHDDYDDHFDDEVPDEYSPDAAPEWVQREELNSQTPRPPHPLAGDRQAFVESRANALNATGLAVSNTPSHLTLLVEDGARFNDVLHDIQPEAATDSLRDDLNGWVHSFIRRYADVEFARRQDSFEVFTGQKLPDPLMHGWLGEIPDDEDHAIGQTLGVAGGIANRMDALGCDQAMAQHLRDVAAYTKEETIMEWAVASRLGILPETAPGPDDNWSPSIYVEAEPQDEQVLQGWEALFKLIEHTDAKTHLRPHLVESTKRFLESEEARVNEEYGQSFEEFRAQFEAADTPEARAANEAGLPEHVVEYMRSHPETAENSYQRRKNEEEQLLRQITTYRERLAGLETAQSAGA